MKETLRSFILLCSLLLLLVVVDVDVVLLLLAFVVVLTVLVMVAVGAFELIAFVLVTSCCCLTFAALAVGALGAAAASLYGINGITLLELCCFESIWWSVLDVGTHSHDLSMVYVCCWFVSICWLLVVGLLCCSVSRISGDKWQVLVDRCAPRFV